MEKIHSQVLSSSVAARFELTTVAQLAVLIHKSTATIYCKISRDQLASLPPIFRAPGSNKPLFVNVDDWIGGHIEYPNQAPIQQAEGKPKPKCGRPSHASKKLNGGVK